jgi:hypothetical protein
VKIPVPVLRFINPMMIALMRSPLHAAVSKDIMAITFTGRRSGRRFTAPVSYVRQGQVVRCFTTPEMRWWRNLRGGAQVSLRIAGEDLTGRAEAVTGDPKRVADALDAFLSRLPRDAPYYDVGLDAQKKPIPGDVERASHNTVLIEIRLDATAS